MAAADIDPDAPLYGDGLGLDSIDILEIALAVSKKYGFQLKADDENNARIFSSLRHLANHVAAHRA
jgi:acyl carrier protein